MRLAHDNSNQRLPFEWSCCHKILCGPFFEKYHRLSDFHANEFELHLFKGRIEDVEASKWKP